MTERVLDQLAVLRLTEKRLRATPCADCGHEWYMHPHSGRCCVPLYREQAPQVCRCRRFADPSERLV